MINGINSLRLYICLSLVGSLVVHDAMSEQPLTTSTQIRLVNRFTWKGYLSDVTWNEDGKLLAANSSHGDSAVLVLDQDGKLVSRIERMAFWPPTQTNAFVAANRIVTLPTISGTASHADVFDARTGLLVDGVAAPTGVSEDPAVHLASSIPSSRLALVLNSGIHVYETRGWKQVMTIPLSRNAIATKVALSTDGAELAVSAASFIDMIGLDGVARKRRIHVLQEYSASIWAFSFSPDGQFLAVSAENFYFPDCSREWGRLNTRCRLSHPAPLQVFSVADGHTVAEYERSSGTVTSLAWSPDSRAIVFAQERTLHVWNPITKQEVAEPLDGKASSLAISPDGYRLAVAVDKSIEIFDLPSGR